MIKKFSSRLSTGARVTNEKQRSAQQQQQHPTHIYGIKQWLAASGSGETEPPNGAQIEWVHVACLMAVANAKL